MNVFLGIDHGTTRTKVLALDPAMRIVAEASAELPQLFPQPGWVEHDPEEIWATQQATAFQAMENARVSPAEIAAIGIAGVLIAVVTNGAVQDALLKFVLQLIHSFSGFMVNR